MLAQNNEYLQEAVSGVRQLTEDEKIRQQCQAREDFAYWERIRNVRMKELGDDLEQAKDELQQTQGELQQTQSELQQANEAFAQKEAELAKALARIAELENR